MFEALTFVDDAGRVVEAEIDGSRMAVPRDDPGLRELMQRYAMMCAQRRNDDIRKAALLGGLVFMVLVIAIVVSARLAWAPWLIGVLSPLFIVIPLVIVWQRDRKRMMAEFREYLAAYGRCGGCGYPLRTLPVDEHGLIVCSECRAAWRADRARFDEPEVTKRDEVSEETAAIKRFLGFHTTFPAVKDLDGRVFRTADPRLPGGRAWLGEDWKKARSRVLGRLFLLRLGHLALALAVVPGAVSMAQQAMSAFRAVGSGLMPSGLQLLAMLTVPFLIVGYPNIVWQIWRYRWPTLGKPVAESLLKEGLCPACSRGLPMVTEGRRVCEHCGGAWSDTMFEKPKA